MFVLSVAIVMMCLRLVATICMCWKVVAGKPSCQDFEPHDIIQSYSLFQTNTAICVVNCIYFGELSNPILQCHKLRCMYTMYESALPFATTCLSTHRLQPVLQERRPIQENRAEQTHFCCQGEVRKFEEHSNDTDTCSLRIFQPVPQ